MLEAAHCPPQSVLPPLVTVAMPVYNAGRYLRPAVLSIVGQTFTDWEFLIIDDGSTDGALKQIDDIDDGRIRIIQDGANRGLAARLNEAIDLARGRYFCRMDQDDISYPERFARQVAALDRDSRLDVVSVRAVTIDERNRATGRIPFARSHRDICARPWIGFYFPHPTWFGRIEWFRKHRYASPGPYFCEDQELLLRSYRESRFAVINEILFGYRIRKDVNWQKLAKTRRTLLTVQLRYFFKSKAPIFICLSVLAFLVRVFSDFFHRIRRGISDHSSGAVDPLTDSKWRAVLRGLEGDPT